MQDVPVSTGDSSGAGVVGTGVHPQPAPFSPPVLSANIPANVSGNMSSHSASSGTALTGNQASALQETTLDEPVMETVKRDLMMVWNKLKKVVMPSADTKDELRNWDLWGPLLLCLLLAILLSIDESSSASSKEAQERSAVVFSSLLGVVSVGAVIVTINAKLLGGNVSFFQNICLLGYCVAPMIAATAVCMVIRLSIPDTTYTCGPGSHSTCTDAGCIDTANVTLNVGDDCKGWNDEDSCIGDAKCNTVHTGVLNVILRLLLTAGGLLWSLRSSLGFLSEVVKEERRALAAYPVCLFFAAISWMVLLRTSSA
mmetsp:Transcript_40540/g.82876  ORF Transcript_40540/g.82876 Transcript_40540/m.82876 type:complete len:313 (+) Transcript_40540:29-967(+)|eukprot:CAMPEP_0181299190 /NCGR_PEP_ID=MMETSP1101-20121128/6206_1 /TAXON_ID=46948 /ORGANISM="Rhodomonas abbreviata, Strain Caron Lab Isolate" /LENGTH=312 /DNA_ID=CAMNT_0023404307 /DNA_START=11 /DNA_END=949 /DNA_ORIENTATION=-